MEQSSPVFLWGYMASGKSRLGKRLAPMMNRAYIDLDEYIEDQYGFSISEIFDKKGEQFFRSIETRALERFAQRNNIIVACGGGTPCFQDNLTIMNGAGTTVFLSVEIEELVKRLCRNKLSRPLVARMNSKKELRNFINKQLGNRMQFYNQARIHYDNTYPRSDLGELIHMIETTEV